MDINLGTSWLRSFIPTNFKILTVEITKCCYDVAEKECNATLWTNTNISPFRHTNLFTERLISQLVL